MSSGVQIRAATFIVVDDNRSVADMIVRRISKRGMRGRAAYSFKEALAVEGQFEVGVFDIDLGDGSGIELAARFIASGRVGHVLFVTGGASQSVQMQARKVGPVLSKPTDLARIDEVVFGLLSPDRANDADDGGVPKPVR